MIRMGRRDLSRLSAVMLASGMLVAGTVAMAGTAAAEDGSQSAVNIATLGVDGSVFTHHGTIDILGDGGAVTGRHEGGTMALRLGGATLETYCIDLGHKTWAGVHYAETDWDHSSLSGRTEALGRIRWILQNSYPTLTVGKVAAETGVSGLTEDEAAAATQAAIWHYSDDVDAVPADGKAAEVTAWLEQRGGSLAEPAPSLQLGPTSVSGRSGDDVGPITVHTSAGGVRVSLDAAARGAGVTVTDRAGKPVTTAVDGQRLYLAVPRNAARGTATVTASVETSIPVGRVFGSVGASNQTLILAGTGTVGVSASAAGAWAPAKGPIPAVSAEKDCTKGGVDVTAANNGDEPFTFTLAGRTHTVSAGKSETVLVDVAEDHKYDIGVSGPTGFGPWHFAGVLDCRTSSASGGSNAGGTGGGAASPVNSPSPAVGRATGGKLAETGSSSATPVIAGIAGVLVVVGGGLVFFLRKRGKNTPDA